jgi:hypothetical protein
MKTLLQLAILGGIGVVVYNAYTAPDGRLKQSITNALSYNWSSPPTLPSSSSPPSPITEEEMYTHTNESLVEQIREEGERGGKKYKFRKVYVMSAARFSDTPGVYLLDISPDNTSQNTFTVQIADKDFHLKPPYILSTVSIQNSRLLYYSLNPLLNPKYPHPFPNKLL